jgi:hypothetical protein
MKVVDYVLVDQVSGEIQVSGRCRDADLDTQPEAGHQIKVVGYGTRATHYYTPMGLCEYTPEQRAAKSQAQPHSRWDNGLMKWVDVRPLAELRAERWSQIKAARAAVVGAPIGTPFGRFDACPASREALAVAHANSRRRKLWRPGTPPVEWTTADNLVVPLDASHLAELLRLIGLRTQQAHAQARALRSRIDAASSIGDLEAITWPQAP